MQYLRQLAWGLLLGFSNERPQTEEAVRVKVADVSLSFSQSLKAQKLALCSSGVSLLHIIHIVSSAHWL